jgi:hypothetical protein
MEDPIRPLTDDHLVEIKDGLDKLDQAERMVEQAIRAGIDVEGEKKRIAELRTKLRRIGTAYFPGRL